MFLGAILNLKILRKNLYYTVYQNTTAYTPLVAMSVGKAVIHRIKNYDGKYKVNITIDGLRKKDGEIVRKELKNLNIKYGKIKIELKDEQDVLWRLVDALAGFTRDYLEKEKYAVDLIGRQDFNNFFVEI